MAVRRIFLKQKANSLEVIGAHPTVAYTDFSGTKKLNVLLPLIGQYFKKSRGYLPPLPPPTPTDLSSGFLDSLLVSIPTPILKGKR